MLSKVVFLLALSSAAIMVNAAPAVRGNNAILRRGEAAAEVVEEPPVEDGDDALTTNDIFLHGLSVKHKSDKPTQY